MIIKKKALFLINPVSGTTGHRRLVKEIEKNNVIFDYVISEYAGQITEIVNKNLDNYNVFVAAGGDGTVNELVRVLEGTNKILAIYPKGSGNGFARELGFKANINTLINAINKGKTLKVDTLHLDDKTFANIAGVGIDSKVAHSFSNMPRRGLLSYVFLTIKTLATYKPVKVRLNINGKHIEGRYLVVEIANTRQLGNNAYIAPMASPIDGKGDVLLVKPFPAALLPYMTYKMFAGELATCRYIDYHHFTDELYIESELNEFHMDGEPVKIGTQAKVSIHKKALKVLDLT